MQLVWFKDQVQVQQTKYETVMRSLRIVRSKLTAILQANKLDTQFQYACFVTFWIDAAVDKLNQTKNFVHNVKIADFLYKLNHVANLVLRLNDNVWKIFSYFHRIIGLLELVQQSCIVILQATFMPNCPRCPVASCFYSNIVTLPIPSILNITWLPCAACFKNVVQCLKFRFTARIG